MPSFSSSNEPGPRGSPQEPNNQQLSSQQQQLRIASLIEGLTNSNWDARDAAASALGNIGPDAREAVPALVTALNDSKRDVRYEAAWALGNIGPDARDAVPALVTALNDPDAAIRRNAAEALSKIFPKA